MNRSLTAALKAGVTILALVLIAQRIDLHELWRVLTTFPLSWVPVMGALLAVGLALSALKWQVVLRSLGRRTAFTELARLFWIGLFFNTFLPGRTGGDVVRAYGLSRSDSVRARSIASVVIDRGMNLFALLAIGAVATFVADGLPTDLTRVVRIAALVSVIGAGCAFVFKQTILTWLPGKLSDIADCQRRTHRCYRQVMAENLGHRRDTAGARAGASKLWTPNTEAVAL